MKKLQKFVLAALAMFVTVASFAQVTTSSLSGQVTDKQGAVVGAAVIATHTPSGTRYYAISNNDGRYSIQGMRSGGPYEVSFQLMGYQTAVYQEIALPLGEVYTQNAVLNEASELLDEVIVYATTSHFTTEKTGASTNISSSQMEAMPTVSRSLTDLTKLSPYANGMSFAGGDGRSTNFTLDGANLNYNFGLSSKLPGGGSPISVDAIDEVQVVIAPYDVRQTNFIGGGVNAVTKSGTNTFKGTAYMYYKSQDMRGNTVAGQDLGERKAASNRIIGFTLGGPIIKNKLFFFVNAEATTAPGQVINYRANKGGEKAEGNVSRTTESDLQKVKDFCMQKWGYDTGSYTDFPGDESNYKVLARIDWNIADGHRLAVRYNFTRNLSWSAPNANSADTGARLSNTYRVGNQSFAFANNMYSQQNNVQTISVDLNSKFSETFSNQFLATVSQLDDVRGSNSDPFPHIDIMYENKLEPYMSLGYELFTWNNGVKNQIITVKDDATFLAGNHKVILGANFEHQYANNAYMRNGALYYRYASLDDFLNQATPESFAITYGWNGNLNPTAQVTFNTVGLYAQDEWDVSKNFKLTYGVRFDTMIFDESDIARNEKFYAHTYRDGMKIDTGSWPNTRVQINPRVGFSWDVNGDKTMKLRGGIGIFQGRIPLVFFTNMPTNAAMVQNSVQFMSNYTNGVKTGYDSRLDQFKGGIITDVATAIDKLGLQTEISESNHADSNKQVDVDKNFRMPQTLKTSLAMDYQLPVDFPLSVTVEGILNKTIWGVSMDNINLDNDAIAKNRFSGADSRYIYPSNKGYVDETKISKNNINAVRLVNTREGYGYSANITVNATPVRNLDLMLAYTRTESKEITGMPGSDPISAWQGIYTVNGPNFATLQRSQYVVPDKVIGNLTWNFWGNKSHLSLYYQGYAGSSISFIYKNDLNGDGLSTDLIYIPTDSREINFVSEAASDAFWKFVEQDKYLSKHKGEYAEAYSAYSPWTHRIDLRFAQDIKFRIGNSTNKFQLSIDLMNAGNLLNSNWGIYKTASSCNNGAILEYKGVNAKNEPTFDFVKNNGEYITKTWSNVVSYAQCWNFQVGIKYMFN